MGTFRWRLLGYMNFDKLSVAIFSITDFNEFNFPICANFVDFDSIQTSKHYQIIIH